MKKKVLVCAMFALILVLNLLNVYGNGVLNYFHAEGSVIASMSGRKIFPLVHDGYSYSDFNTYRDYARSQWSSAGISSNIVSNKYDASIEMFGGKESTLMQYDPDIKYYRGLTLNKSFEQVEDRQFNGRTIYVWKLHRVQVLVPTIFLGTSKSYQNMFTHEMGHALGYANHSPNNDDCMYSSPSSSRYKLSTRDQQHLSQMY